MGLCVLVLFGCERGLSEIYIKSKPSQRFNKNNFRAVEILTNYGQTNAIKKLKQWIIREYTLTASLTKAAIRNTVSGLPITAQTFICYRFVGRDTLAQRPTSPERKPPFYFGRFASRAKIHNKTNLYICSNKLLSRVPKRFLLLYKILLAVSTVQMGAVEKSPVLW